MAEYKTSWREELAWAAGFFDGEGYMGLTRHKALQLAITQVDRRPLDRFKALCSAGTIHGPNTRVGRQPWHTFNMTGFHNIQHIMAAMWQFLSPVKKAQYTLAVGNMTKNPSNIFWKTATHCQRGHRYTAETTYITKSRGRVCKPCANMKRSIARHAKKVNTYGV